MNRVDAVGLGPRSALALAMATIAGLGMFLWPLLIAPPADGLGHSTDAPFVFLLAMPALIVILLAALAEGGLDSKALAMLGVLAAVNAALRPLGAGTAGIETVFFLLILGGRVFGPAFGFLLGSVSLFASALLTAGVGPWLPFQMLAASWVGMGAGLLPKGVRGRAEIALLVGYGVLAAYGYGLLMSLWTWPFILGGGTDLSYLPGAAVLDNLHRFGVYFATTSLGWDTGRAITNAVAIWLVGPAVLVCLRRAAHKAAFDAAPQFQVATMP